MPKTMKIPAIVGLLFLGQHPDTWRGQNLLGFALMDVREELRNGSEP
jgi:predicted NAD-dependent protein-ADP-ribosyltransferase YbiA (DUF1768 family)